MHPIARDEVYRIGREAIVNACTHSGGKRLNIEVVYSRNVFLRVQDDGRGIAPGHLAPREVRSLWLDWHEGARNTHWGKDDNL